MAGLPKGCVTQGLCKSLGKDAAEAGASTRELKDLLIHKTMQQADL